MMEIKDVNYKNVSEIVAEKSDYHFYLEDRWNNEKEYEDFNDYKKIILKIFKDFPDTKIDKNFNITITGKERKITIRIRTYRIQLEVDKIMGGKKQNDGLDFFRIWDSKGKKRSRS